MKPGPFREGKVHVLSEKCSTCIFRPGNLMRLEPGRVKEMVKDSIEGGGAITCHATYDIKEKAVCRGFFDSYAQEVVALRLAVAMGIIVEDEPPEKKGDFNDGDADGHADVVGRDGAVEGHLG